MPSSPRGLSILLESSAWRKQVVNGCCSAAQPLASTLPCAGGLGKHLQLFAELANKDCSACRDSERKPAVKRDTTGRVIDSNGAPKEHRRIGAHLQMCALLSTSVSVCKPDTSCFCFHLKVGGGFGDAPRWHP